MSEEMDTESKGAFMKFEECLEANGGNQDAFWSQRGVKKRIGQLRADVEALETAACNNKCDLDLIPDQIFSVARRIGVSPEMISDHVGKDVLFSRELERDHMKVAPNGMVIPLKPTMEEFLDGDCGNKKAFWEQTYVQTLVKDAQIAKKGREDIAEELGVTVKDLVKQIEKQNKKDEMSEYERLRQENIADRMLLFKQLGFQDLKNDVKPLKMPNRKSENVILRRPKSLRIQKKKLNTKSQTMRSAYYVPNAIGKPLQLRQTLKMMQNREQKLKDLNEVSTIVNTKWSAFKGSTFDVESFHINNGRKSCNLDLVGVAQLTENPIQCCDANPKQFLIAVGDNLGDIGLWLGHEKTIKFKAHTFGISSLTFDPFTPSTLIASTSDGYIKKLDLKSQTLKTIFSQEEDINWHMPWTQNNIIIGHESYVDLLDLRDGKGYRKFEDVTNGSKIAIEKKNNVAAVLTRDKQLCLYDMRFLASAPLSTTELPYEGSRVLFNSNDKKLAVASRDIVSIYDVNNQNDVKQVSYLKQFNSSQANHIAWHPSRSTNFFMPNSTTCGFTGMVVSTMNIHYDLPIAEFPIFCNQDLSLYTFNDNQPFVAVCNALAQGSLGLIAQVDFQIPNY